MPGLVQRFPVKVVLVAIGAVVGGLVLSDNKAHALVVSVNGLDYDVTTFTGRFVDNTSKFETEANGALMPWWGSKDDAKAFASAVGSSLGLPNQGAMGPYFAFKGTINTSVDIWRLFTPWGPTYMQEANVQTLGTHTYAQATLVPAAGSANVPGPLPAVGLAVAFGFSRQLRKRIKANASNPPSASAQA